MTDTFTPADYQRTRLEVERLIPLGENQFAIIDEDDLSLLSQWKWTCSYNGYAWRRESLGYPNGVRKRRIIFMHRQVMQTPHDMHTDHINGNKLDNRKCNLRICTRSENLQNRISKCGASKYKGVYWDRSNKKWVAQIVINKKPKFLGRFEFELDAAKTYNEAAAIHFKHFAKFNTL